MGQTLALELELRDLDLLCSFITWEEEKVDIKYFLSGKLLRYDTICKSLGVQTGHKYGNISSRGWEPWRLFCGFVKK